MRGNLRADIQKLDVNLASNNALTNLRKRIQTIQMAPVVNISYIEAGAAVVAKR